LSIGSFYHGAMRERIKREWRTFAAEPPGHRFERHYERQKSLEGGILGRLTWVFAGVFFLLAGFVMLFTPGPGLLSMGFGFTCLARESRRMSRFCDRTEMWIRRVWERWRRRGS
jgi:hypothetical protein